MEAIEVKLNESLETGKSPESQMAEYQVKKKLGYSFLSSLLCWLAWTCVQIYMY